FVRALDRLVGIEGLLADPELDGGGLQQTLPGGFLNVHTDFLAHSKRRTWSRQVNLLLFLNKEWEESHRGWLEFWDPRVTRCVRQIEPIFNRCVVFRTSATSFHGVPAGVACPEGDSRKSIALYYFRDEGKTCPLRPTRYVPLPKSQRRSEFDGRRQTEATSGAGRHARGPLGRGDHAGRRRAGRRHRARPDLRRHGRGLPAPEGREPERRHPVRHQRRRHGA